MGLEENKTLSPSQEPKDLVHRTPFQYVRVFSGLSGSEMGISPGEYTWAFMVKKKILLLKKNQNCSGYECIIYVF